MDRKIKLWHVVESFGGGVFSSLNQLCRHTDLDAFEVSIIHSLRAETPENYREFFDPRVRLIYVPMGREINPSHDWRAFVHLRGLLRRERPDVVHLHSSKAGVLGRIACRTLGISNVFYSPRGFSFMRSDVSPLKRKIFYSIEKLAALSGGTIVSVSRDEDAAARTLSAHCMLIPNGVDLALIQEVLDAAPAATPSPGTVRIGYAAIITPQKSPESFCLMAKELASPTVRFLWIGDGPLRHIIEDSGADVEITGWVKRRESLSFMAALDIYAHPSLWEGMPNAILEAMALGKPVVASDIVGNRDLVRHGETGFLARTPQEGIGYLRELIQDPSLRQRMGQAARAIIEEQHSAADIVRRYTDMYMQSLRRL